MSSKTNRNDYTVFMIISYSYTNCRDVNRWSILMNAMDIQYEVERIKKELVDLIVIRLKENKMEAEKAQKLAADFLAILPVNDQKDLLIKLKQLGETYQEMREFYVQELTKYNEEQREHALLQMRNAIAEGKIENAIQVAKQMQQNSI